MTNSTETFEVPADLSDNSLSTRLSELHSHRWDFQDSWDTKRILELVQGVPADTPVGQLSAYSVTGRRFVVVPKCVVSQRMQNHLENMMSTEPIRGWEFLLWRLEDGYISCLLDTGNVVSADVCAPYHGLLRAVGALPEDYVSAIPVSALLNDLPKLVQAGEHSGKIVYYPNGYAPDAKMQYMRAGRYIKRVRPDLSDERVKNLAASVASRVIQVELNFTKAGDPLGIADVYIKGPVSCMSGSGKHYHDALQLDGRLVHPAEVYGHPDNNLRLAYLVYKDKIVARAWTNCRTMTYSTMYGKCDQYRDILEIFSTILAEAGYLRDEETTMWDEKLLRIELDNGAIICPYIDPGNLGVSIEDDYLIAGGPYEANYETGCLHDWDNTDVCDNLTYCDHCDTGHNDYEVSYSNHLQMCICDDCAVEHTERAIVSVYRGRADSDSVWNADARELARPFQGFSFVYVDAEDFVEITIGVNEGMYLHIDDVHIDENGDVWDMHYIEDSNLSICEDCNAVCSSEEYNHEEHSCLVCSPLEDAQLEGAVA